MNQNFAIIGGDLRSIKLAGILLDEGNIIYTYGLENAEELQKINDNKNKFCIYIYIINAIK